MKKTLILGLGNVLLRDDGVGVRAIEKLGDLGDGLSPMVEKSILKVIELVKMEVNDDASHA